MRGIKSSRPVGRVLSPRRVGEDDHQSGTRIAQGLKRPTRGFGPGTLGTLLFGLAPRRVWPAGSSHCRRWALAPPFHPSPTSRGVCFCATFRPRLLAQSAPGRYPVRCPEELGPSSPIKSKRSPGLLDSIHYINLPYSNRSSAWFASSSARLFIALGIESTSNSLKRRCNSITLANIGCKRGLRTLYRCSICRTTSSESIRRLT